MLCLFPLFVSSFDFNGPEMSHCGSGQKRNIYLFYLFKDGKRKGEERDKGGRQEGSM